MVLSIAAMALTTVESHPNGDKPYMNIEE